MPTIILKRPMFFKKGRQFLEGRLFLKADTYENKKLVISKIGKTEKLYI